MVVTRYEIIYNQLLLYVSFFNFTRIMRPFWNFCSCCQLPGGLSEVPSVRKANTQHTSHPTSHLTPVLLCSTREGAGAANGRVAHFILTLLLAPPCGGGRRRRLSRRKGARGRASHRRPDTSRPGHLPQRHETGAHHPTPLIRGCLPAVAPTHPCGACVIVFSQFFRLILWGSFYALSRCI